MGFSMGLISGLMVESQFFMAFLFKSFMQMINHRISINDKKKYCHANHLC